MRADPAWRALRADIRSEAEALLREKLEVDVKVTRGKLGSTVLVRLLLDGEEISKSSCALPTKMPTK